MKTELRQGLAPGVIELWHNDHIIGMVVGAEGPGVEVLSEHSMLPRWHADEHGGKRVEIRIASEPPSAQPFPPAR